MLLQNRKFQLLHPNWVQIKEFEIKDPKILIEKRRKVPDISYINLQVKYQWENNNYNNFLEKVNIREQPWFIYNSSLEAQEMKRKLDYILKSKDYELYINIHSPKQAKIFFGIHTFDWRQSFIGILIIQVFQALFLMILPFIIYVLYLRIIHKNKS
ncbi:hypothetical protein G9F31_01485 [Acinetobacter sp. 187]|uniref:hypothetical protein n=1 Tax=Acinetobacter lanii TaxID=2715163 RepID=UPI0014088F5E|nr:hypothetical protein [Acinetobacter lanii]NHC02456.1 hypothetical protein [Acinetobacter lanii]